MQTEDRSRTITTLLNGTNFALSQVVPIEHTISKASLHKEAKYAAFGVITRDMKGKIVISGDMLSGEIGNMIAGNLSTNIMNKGIAVDITAPSIIEGNGRKCENIWIYFSDLNYSNVSK